MKILAYSSYYVPYTSGLTIYLERIARHLSHKNDISVLTFKHDPSLPDSARSENITVDRMPFLFRVSKGFISPQSVWYFAKALRGAEAVVINIPNAEALALVVLAKILRKRVIVIYHCEVYLGPGLFARFVNAILNKSVSIQLSLADRIVACPDYVEERSFYESLKEKIVKTVPPIETVKPDEVYLQKLTAAQGKKKRVGYVGRIAREKGIEYLIDALATINDSRYELVIVSPGETVGEQSYRTMITQQLAASRVKYKLLSQLSESELAAVYESLNVLVLPSVNPTEAFGMVQAEAMLHGTPVVATDRPGVRLPVQLTGAGALVPPADPTRLAAAIKTVIDTTFKREDIKKNALRAFDPKKVYEVYEGLLLGNQ